MASDGGSRNIRFINEVEKHPCIYNFTLQDYTKKHATDAAWHSVAAEMNDTVYNCKEKWRNLRTVFVRKMKPDASGNRNTRPYYLTDAMQFLLPFVRVHQNNNNNNSTETPTRSSSSRTTPKDYKEDTEEDTIEYKYDFYDNEEGDYGDDGERSESSSQQFREMNGLDCLTSITPNITTTTTKNVPASSRQIQNRKRKVSRGSPFVHYGDVVVKKAKMNSLYGSGSGDGDDPCKLFLMSLLPDVHAMTDAQLRKFRKMVLDVIDVVLEETPGHT